MTYAAQFRSLAGLAPSQLLQEEKREVWISTAENEAGDVLVSGENPKAVSQWPALAKKTAEVAKYLETNGEVVTLEVWGEDTPYGIQWRLGATAKERNTLSRFDKFLTPLLKKAVKGVGSMLGVSGHRGVWDLEYFSIGD